MVLEGIKRVVLLDPDVANFTCTRPTRTACWTGVDILWSPPAQVTGHLLEVILRPGEALFIPEMWWHAVENLTPVVAVGLNNLRPCTGERFAKLQPPREESLWGRLSPWTDRSVPGVVDDD